MEYNTYTATILDFSAVLLVLENCVIISLSNRILAELVEKLFGIMRSDNQTLIMNFYGVQIDFFIITTVPSISYWSISGRCLDHHASVQRQMSPAGTTIIWA
jgi:hypothetical protein